MKKWNQLSKTTKILLGVSTGLVVTSAVVIPTSIMLSNQKKSKLLNRRTTKADVGMIKDEITNSYDYKIKNSYAFQSLSASEKEIYIERFDKYVNEIISAAKSVGMSTNDLVDRLGEEALEDSIKVLDYKAADKIIANMKRGILDSNLGDANKWAQGDGSGQRTEEQRVQLMNNALGVIDNATAVAVANSTSPEQFMATFYDEINTANAIVGNNAEIATNHAMLMDIINNLKPREQYLINESGTVDINNILTNTDITADLNSFFDIQAFNDRGLPLLNEDNNGDIVKLSLEDSRAELHNILRKKGVRDSITQPVIDIPGYTLTATLKVNSQADTNIFYNQIGIDFSLVKNDTTDQPTTTVTQSFGYTDNLPKFIIKNSHTRIENLGNAYLNDLAFTQLPVPGDRIAYTDFKNSLPMNNHGQIINGSSVSKELLSSVMSWNQDINYNYASYFDFNASVYGSNNDARTVKFVINACDVSTKPMGEGIIPTGDGSEQLVDDLSSVTYVTSDISLPLTEREAKDLTYAFISTIAKTASFINTTIEVVHLPSEERVKQIKKYRDWLLGFTVVETTILASSMALAAIYFATAIVSFGATTASAIAATVCAGISITGVVLSQLRYADVDHVYEIFTEIQENAGYKKLKAYLKTNETELTRFVVNATNTLPISNGSPMNKIEQWAMEKFTGSGSNPEQDRWNQVANFVATFYTQQFNSTVLNLFAQNASAGDSARVQELISTTINAIANAKTATQQGDVFTWIAGTANQSIANIILNFSINDGSAISNVVKLISKVIQLPFTLSEITGTIEIYEKSSGYISGKIKSGFSSWIGAIRGVAALIMMEKMIHASQMALVWAVPAVIAVAIVELAITIVDMIWYSKFNKYMDKEFS